VEKYCRGGQAMAHAHCTLYT